MSKLSNHLDRPAPPSCIRTKKKRTVNNITFSFSVCSYSTWQLTTKSLARTEEPSDMLHSTPFVTGDSRGMEEGEERAYPNWPEFVFSSCRIQRN